MYASVIPDIVGERYWTLPEIFFAYIETKGSGLMEKIFFLICFYPVPCALRPAPFFYYIHIPL